MSDSKDDQMSPDASPGAVSSKTGVRRVNNMPMYIVGGVMGVFLLVMVLVASDRAAKQNQTPQAKGEKAVSSSMFAKEITGDRQDGIIQARTVTAPVVPALVPPSGTSPLDGLAMPDAAGAVAVARPDLDKPPMPPNSAGNQRSNGQTPGGQVDEEANRIRLMKLQQFDEAVKAKTSVNASAPRSAASSGMGGGGGGSFGNVNNSDTAAMAENMSKLAATRQRLATINANDPTASYKAQLALAQSLGVGGGEGGSTGGAGTAPQLLQPSASGSNGMGQFANNGQGDRWKLDSKAEAPRSPYELRAGFVVPGTLISGINSELPGQIMGQVAQNVFDTATGKHLLIPQGSRLVGTYSSAVAYGQARVLVAWQRIIFPDGKAMDIGSMPGADNAGYAGFADQVNNHYFRLFASALLMSGVTAGIAQSQPQQTVNSAPTFSSSMSQALGQQLGQVTAQLISKNMNIAPTIEIRPGYRFNIIVTKDMTFSKPYQSFDY